MDFLCHKYLEVVHDLFKRKDTGVLVYTNKTEYGKKLTNAEFCIISDLDGTLV